MAGVIGACPPCCPSLPPTDGVCRYTWEAFWDGESWTNHALNVSLIECIEVGTCYPTDWAYSYSWEGFCVYTKQTCGEGCWQTTIPPGQENCANSFDYRPDYPDSGMVPTPFNPPDCDCICVGTDLTATISSTSSCYSDGACSWATYPPDGMGHRGGGEMPSDLFSSLCNFCDFIGSDLDGQIITLTKTGSCTWHGEGAFGFDYITIDVVYADGTTTVTFGDSISSGSAGFDGGFECSMSGETSSSGCPSGNSYVISPSSSDCGTCSTVTDDPLGSPGDTVEYCSILNISLNVTISIT